MISRGKIVMQVGMLGNKKDKRLVVGSSIEQFQLIMKARKRSEKTRLGISKNQ
jgi:hypothetical protein